MTQIPALLTTAEVADRLRVDRATVRRWAADGTLRPAFTTPGGHRRFSAGDIDRLISRGAADERDKRTSS